MNGKCDQKMDGVGNRLTLATKENFKVFLSDLVLVVPLRVP